MIDWWSAFRNGVWIVGLSVGLAAWSYARWWAHEHGVRFRHTLAEPLFLVPFSAGMALFSLGLALCGRRWWETAAWGVLTVLFGLHGMYSRRAGRR